MCIDKINYIFIISKNAVKIHCPRKNWFFFSPSIIRVIGISLSYSVIRTGKTWSKADGAVENKIIHDSMMFNIIKPFEKMIFYAGKTLNLNHLRLVCAVSLRYKCTMKLNTSLSKIFSRVLAEAQQGRKLPIGNIIFHCVVMKSSIKKLLSSRI